jgi:hypothetical protein
MNNQWPGFGITDEVLEEKAEWLSRDHPRFQGRLVMFFRTAASLLRFTQQDFTVLPLVYVQMVIGLEKMLRLVYQGDKRQLHLKEMLQQAYAEGIFADLKEIECMSCHPWMNRDLEIIQSRADVGDVAELIPNIRNELLHGEFTLTFEFLALALHVRRMVDALIGRLPPSLIETEVFERGRHF